MVIEWLWNSDEMVVESIPYNIQYILYLNIHGLTSGW